jgi:hypothetical protein
MGTFEWNDFNEIGRMQMNERDCDMMQCAKYSLYSAVAVVERH